MNKRQDKAAESRGTGRRKQKPPITDDAKTLVRHAMKGINSVGGASNNYVPDINIPAVPQVRTVIQPKD